jgi:hypothetical protein
MAPLDSKDLPLLLQAKTAKDMGIGGTKGAPGIGRSLPYCGSHARSVAGRLNASCSLFFLFTWAQVSGETPLPNGPGQRVQVVAVGFALAVEQLGNVCPRVLAGDALVEHSVELPFDETVIDFGGSNFPPNTRVSGRVRIDVREAIIRRAKIALASRGRTPFVGTWVRQRPTRQSLRCECMIYGSVLLFKGDLWHTRMPSSRILL